MTEQMPGELIYEYTIQSTGATSYGVPPLDAADGLAHFTEGPPVGDLCETVTMATSEPDYAWVNPTSDLGPGHGRPSQRRGTCHGLRCLASVGQPTSLGCVVSLMTLDVAGSSEVRQTLLGLTLLGLSGPTWWLTGTVG
jgi:hypothetical protein